MLHPGEIDSQIARDQLDLPPAPIWDAPTLSACALLYHRYVEPAAGAWVPDAAFCDLRRWVFLEYLVQRCNVVLFGSNDSSLTQLELTTPSHNVRGWDAPRLFAFSQSISPVFRAILDVARLRALDYGQQTTFVERFTQEGEQQRLRAYFGLDYRVLPHAPWRRGTMYLYARADLPHGFDLPAGGSGRSDRPIRPLARLDVDPWDWPLLGSVHGIDVDAQREREYDTYARYPWPGDDAIHPARRRRPLAEEARTHLETHYAEDVSLADLGQQAGVSAFTLLRTFRSATGLSPREFQTLLRVTNAKRLLRTGLPIAGVAAEVGYCDQSHLTRHFRRVVGLTPGRYLRLQESPILRP